MTGIAEVVVMASGLYLVGLAAALVTVPSRAERFLEAFASSVRTHYAEQALRLSAGVAFMVHGPRMRFPELFTAFGWILTLTSGMLLLVPWRWHRRYAEWAVPLAIRHRALFALGAASLGVLVLYAASA